MKGSVSWLPNQFRKHCQSKQQPKPRQGGGGVIFKILGKGGISILWWNLITPSKPWNYEQRKKHIICFRSVIYRTCVLNRACAGWCEQLQTFPIQAYINVLTKADLTDHYEIYTYINECKNYHVCQWNWKT